MGSKDSNNSPHKQSLMIRAVGRGLKSLVSHDRPEQGQKWGL